MADSLDSLLGQSVALEALQLRRPRELLTFLQSGVHPYAHLREVRTGGVLAGETVVLEVDVEVGQVTAADIRDREAVSITFGNADDDWPEVLALRDDFPVVLHTNIRPFDTPKSLCLYEARFLDSRSSWTTVSIVERIREWLRDTAANELHRDDQPVEQLFLVTPNCIILPSSFEFQLDVNAQNLRLQYFDWQTWGQILLCREGMGNAAFAGQPGYTLFSFVSPTLTQAAIRREPRSLGDLQHIFAAEGTDFLTELRGKVAALEASSPNPAATPVVLISFPRSRKENGDIERIERWAFHCDLSLGDLGAALGVWQVQDVVAVHLFGAGIDEKRASDVSVTILNPSYMVAPEMAAKLSRTEHKHLKITAVGMGALGSQVTALLARTGLGRWTLVDGDVLLPHNVVRHLASGAAIGFPKVNVVQSFLDSLFETSVVDQTIFGDVLRAGPHVETLQASLQTANLVLDFSASAAVQRDIARMASNRARCISCFLNPAGTALVVLTEDDERKEQLDSLEMQYYRALMSHPALAGHLPADVHSVRYARSCGDLTAQMSTDNIAVFAGLAAKSVRRSLESLEPSISIYQMGEQGQVEYVAPEVSRTHRVQVGEWTVIWDEITLIKMLQIRDAIHPAETGGVILGVWDLDVKALYLVDAQAAPPDSEETEQSFVRGTSGLGQALGDILTKTAGVVQYVGEWHSHPDGYAANPSVDDLILFGWLDQRAQEMGFAPVMAILAADEVRWICDGHTTRVSFDTAQGQAEVSN